MIMKSIMESYVCFVLLITGNYSDPIRPMIEQTSEAIAFPDCWGCHGENG